jgi:hypothetical protein
VRVQDTASCRPLSSSLCRDEPGLSGRQVFQQLCGAPSWNALVDAQASAIALVRRKSANNQASSATMSPVAGQGGAQFGLAPPTTELDV